MERVLGETPTVRMKITDEGRMSSLYDSPFPRFLLLVSFLYPSLPQIGRDSPLEHLINSNSRTLIPLISDNNGVM